MGKANAIRSLSLHRNGEQYDQLPMLFPATPMAGGNGNNLVAFNVEVTMRSL
ncbi:MAG: hypothetical protein IPO01_14220 [Chitinophagaceae bacterium]|nr:hypothetical protein [Chitinophagaceae bacterium]